MLTVYLQPPYFLLLRLDLLGPADTAWVIGHHPRTVAETFVYDVFAVFSRER